MTRVRQLARYGDRLMYLSVASIHLAMFVAVTGGRILIPSRTDWLMWGDSAQHYLGWEIFRKASLGVWPPGASPGFGVGYSSSIVYSDSIPLLAIPLKFLLAGFDGQFQFLGIWILISFILQGVLGAAILRRLQTPALLVIPLSVLFSLAPAFLYRLTVGGYGHIALFSHFLVLAGIYLSAREQIPHARWTTLILCSILVQFYIAFMVIAMYLGNVVHHLVVHRQTRPIAMWQLTRRWLVPQFVGVTIVMYLAGFFMGTSPVDEGFGIFRADLLTFFDPNPVDLCCWSGVLPDITLIDGSHEGFSYLGSGVLVTLAVITPICWRRVWNLAKVVTPLMWSVVPLMLLGLSNQIQVGGEETWVIPLGDLTALTGIIRSSGRFVWPLMYVAIIIAGLTISTIYSRNKSLGLILVMFILGFQIVESWSALQETRERFQQSQRQAPVLISPRWDEVVQGRTCLLSSPPQAKGKLWIDFAELASRRRMATNASYLSRWDQSLVARLSEEIAEQLDNGEISKDCLYVITNPDSQDEFFYLQTVRTPDGLRYQVEEIDGFIAVAVAPD